MNPSEIKSVMAEIGGQANKRLGQHFLIDRSALEAIVDAADIQAEDHVLEIGPGLGVLTKALLKKGAAVSAIEQDRRFIGWLEKMGSDRLTVMHGDAADMDWETLLDGRPWKFVSNLPYSITSLALRKALWRENPPAVIVVLVQREVAERAISTASPSSSPSTRGRAKTSLLSLMVALASREAKIVKRVPAGAFFPPPKVESAILRIVPLSPQERVSRWGIDPEQIMLLAKRGFAHPRKLLASNLGLSETERAVFGTLGLNVKARAEDLSPVQWAELAKALV